MNKKRWSPKCSRISILTKIHTFSSMSNHMCISNTKLKWLMSLSTTGIDISSIIHVKCSLTKFYCYSIIPFNDNKMNGRTLCLRSYRLYLMVAVREQRSLSHILHLSVARNNTFTEHKLVTTGVESQRHCFGISNVI